MSVSKKTKPRPKRVKVEIVDKDTVPLHHAAIDPLLDGPIDAELASEIEATFDPAFDPAFDPNAHPGFGRALAQPAEWAGSQIGQPTAISDSKALTSVDPVTTYLAEIRRYPILTREEEQVLAKRYRETGDPTAAERLVTSNLRFVVKIAAEYTKFGAKLIDLIQEGNVGLMHAVKEFNPYKNVRMITYAVWWIRGYIQEYLMRQYSMVRIGTTQNQRKLFYRLGRERRNLESMGQEPTFALLSSRLGVPQDEVETMAKRMSGRDVSLSQPLDGSSTATLLDLEPGDSQGIDDALGHLEELEVLKQNLDTIRDELNEKELFLLESRILSDEPLTLQEIGDKYGVTREAVRQMEARLVARIRTAVMGSLEAKS